MAHPESWIERCAHDGLHVSVLLGERCIVIGGVVETPGRREWIELLARELLPDYEVRNELGVQAMHRRTRLS